MSRSVIEWVGKNDDTPVPPRVRLRVFLNADGICAICTRKIISGEAWICDHEKALINGGANRENNLQPICGFCDKKVKTPADVVAKSRTYRKRKAHHGVRYAKRTIPGRRFDGTPIPSRWRS